MKLFQKFTLIFCLSIFSLISGCRFKEGPKLSFRSVKTRLSGTWIVNNYFEDSANKTKEWNILFPNWKLVIEEDGDYSITSTPLGVTIEDKGKWVLNDNKTEINFMSNGTKDNKWKILRLKNKEFTATQTNSNNVLVRQELIQK